MRSIASIFSRRAHREQNALIRLSYLSVVALLGLFLLPGRAAAQTAACPGVVSSNLTLSGDIIANSADVSPCITVTSDNVTINLAGHTINVSALGSNPNAAVAIDTGTTNGAVITGGTIITDYTTTGAGNAIEAEGGSNISISGLFLYNKPGGTLCTNSTRDNLNYGVAISASGITGGTISGNAAECYQTAILLLNSAIPKRGSGSISGNSLTGNTYDLDEMGATAGTYSAGIVLNNSSGWSVSNNGVSFNASTDAGGNCVFNPPNLPSCSFALQLINASSANTISGNTVQNNFGGGIYTSSDTSKNKIVNNVVTNNGSYDLYDDSTSSHSNAWRGNTCTLAGGSVSPQKCP